MASVETWYNGYSPQERGEMLKVGNRLLASGQIAKATGPCDLCSDPDTPVEYHSEDYGIPFRWSPPATYSLCRNCHRDKLHKRFGRPELWAAFLAHVRRGGYARELKNPAIALELKHYREAVKQGKPAVLHRIRPYMKAPGTEWFTHLSMDSASLRDPQRFTRLFRSTYDRERRWRELQPTKDAPEDS